MELEIINKLYLELSQITTATTAREILLQKQLAEPPADKLLCEACERNAAQLLRDFMRAYVQQQAQAAAPADEVEATAIHSTIGAHIAKNP